MKKKTMCLLALAGLSLTLASCGEKTSGTSNDTTGIMKNATTITLWSTTGQNNRPQLESYIEAFKKVEPNITVNNVYQSGSYNDLESMISKGFLSDNYPDIVQGYPDNVANYIDYGKAVKLDSYINNAEYGWNDFDKSDIIEAFQDEGREYTVEGTYSVPYSKSTEEMFYNADVLIGLDLSKYDSTINSGAPLNAAYFDKLTWTELFDKLCPAITKYNDALPTDQKILKTDQAYHGIFAYDSDDNLFITLAKQYGYGYTSVKNGFGSVDFNNDGMKSVLKTFKKAYDNGYFLTKGSAGGNYTNTYFTLQNTLFSVGSTGGVKYQFDAAHPMNVGVARIPQADINNPWTINQGPSLTVLDHNSEDRKLASWLFYKYMTNTTNSLDWAINSGYMGIRNSNYESDEYKEATSVEDKQEKTLDILMAKSASYLSKITPNMFVSPAFKGSSQCRTQVGGLMTSVLTSNGTDATIDDLFAKAESTAKLYL